MAARGFSETSAVISMGFVSIVDWARGLVPSMVAIYYTCNCADSSCRSDTTLQLSGPLESPCRGTSLPRLSGHHPPSPSAPDYPQQWGLADPSRPRSVSRAPSPSVYCTHIYQYMHYVGIQYSELLSSSGLSDEVLPWPTMRRKNSRGKTCPVDLCVRSKL